VDRVALIASRATVVRDRGRRHERHHAELQRRKMAGEVALLPTFATRIVVADGLRCGMLTALARLDDDSTGHVRWLWRCDCGEEKAIRADAVTEERTLSCGCASSRRRKR